MPNNWNMVVNEFRILERMGPEELNEERQCQTTGE